MSFFSLFIYFYLGCTGFVHPIFNMVAFIILLIINIRKRRLKNLKIGVIFLLIGIGSYIFCINKLPYSSVGIVVESKNNYFIFQTFSGRYYIANKNNSYQVFDLLKIQGDVKKYAFNFYESQFDFNDYLKDKLVFYQIEDVKIKPLFLPFFRVNSLVSKGLSIYEDEVKNFLSQFLFALNLDSSYSSLVNTSGLGYYLSISSFHLYFLLGIIRKLSRVKLKEKTTDFILIIFAFFFMVFTSYKLAVVRLFIYQIIYYLNEYHFKNKVESLDKIGLTYLIVGFLSPSSLLTSSFYYSFPLLIFLDSVNKMIYYEAKYPKICYILLINLFFVPLNLYYNGYFNIFSIFLAVLLSPFLLFIYLISIISLIVPLNFLVNFLVRGILNILKFFNRFDLKIYIPGFNFGFVIFYYLFFLAFLYFFRTKRFKKRNDTFLLFSLFIALSTLPVNELYERSVSIINVGQGDSILIRDRNKHYLIDTGGNLYNDLATNSLIPFFRKKGINHLDKVFITHFDFDHYGALESLQKHFKVNEVITQENFTPISYSSFEMVNLNNYQDLWENKNDSSLVLYLKFKDYKFLFMGDASLNVEKRIVKDYPTLKVDILKLGHHGSSTSSCEEFISFLKPQEAIISCGLKNKYHHPHQETIDVLNKYHIKIRNTSKEGTIRYFIN